MNFSDVLKALNQASAFELYRMRAAIDRVLDEPRWLLSIQSRLRVGQSVEYFDPQANTLRHGQILEMRRKQAVVLDRDDGRRWLISYAAINLDGADVQIGVRGAVERKTGLSRCHCAGAASVQSSTRRLPISRNAWSLVTNTAPILSAWEAISKSSGASVLP